MTEHSPTAAFAAGSHLDGANADYIDQLAAKHATDPASVDAAWADFFKSLGDTELDAKRQAHGPSWARADWPPQPADDLTAALTGEWPVVPDAKGAAKKITEKAAAVGVPVSQDQIQRAVLDSIRAIMLIRAYRIRGHLAADLTRSASRPRATIPSLTPPPMASPKPTWTARSSSTMCWVWNMPACARSSRS